MSIRWNKHLVILYDKQRGTLICDALESAIGSAFPECDIITVDDIGYTNPIHRFWRVKVSHFYAKNARFFVSWFSKFKDKKETVHLLLSKIRLEGKAITGIQGTSLVAQ